MVEVRPALRGQFHLLMALASPAALLVLVLVADNAREYVGGAIFGVSLLLLFSTSSAYHLIERGQAVLQRIDRSMIFVLIAGHLHPVLPRVAGKRLGHSHSLGCVGVGGHGSRLESGPSDAAAVAQPGVVPGAGVDRPDRNRAVRLGGILDRAGTAVHGRGSLLTRGRGSRAPATRTRFRACSATTSSSTCSRHWPR